MVAGLRVDRVELTVQHQAGEAGGVRIAHAAVASDCPAGLHLFPVRLAVCPVHFGPGDEQGTLFRDLGCLHQLLRDPGRSLAGADAGDQGAFHALFHLPEGLLQQPVQRCILGGHAGGDARLPLIDTGPHRVIRLGDADQLPAVLPAQNAGKEVIQTADGDLQQILEPAGPPVPSWSGIVPGCGCGRSRPPSPRPVGP